jgi:hypothetical protein
VCLWECFQKWLGHEDFDLTNGFIHWWIQILNRLLGDDRNYGRWGLVGESNHCGRVFDGAQLALAPSSLCSASWPPWVKQLWLTTHFPPWCIEISETLSYNKPSPLRLFLLDVLSQQWEKQLTQSAWEIESSQSPLNSVSRENIKFQNLKDEFQVPGLLGFCRSACKEQLIQRQVRDHSLPIFSTTYVYPRENFGTFGK